MLFSGQSDSPRARDSGSFDRIAGRYDIEEVVGRGGMGAVYRVLDLRTGTRLALKRLHVKNRKDEALAHFEREFYVLAQLRHPRIIAVHDYSVDASSAYYTMELLQGADMRTLAPLPWTLVGKHLREIATSLALLHARKLVHRDVTPQNVRVGQDGHCKLIDFGALADFGASGTVIGTPPCVPPEAVDGKPIDQRLDLYALGCLGYWMLTGRHAYPATDPRQLRAFWARTLSPPSVGRPTQGEGGVPLPEIPPALDALVMKLLALDPMARPSSAGEVIDQLDAITRNALSSSQRPPRFSSAPEDTSLAESYLQSAPLCGRKVELEPLKPALERTRRGRGTSVILEGPQGVGRTRLLADVALRTRLAGFTTLHVDAAAHGQPLSAVRALAQQLTGTEPDADFAHAQLHGLFFEAARKRPIALIVDDVHRMDEASLRVLGTLAHDARRVQLLIVAAARGGDEALSESGLSALRHCSTARALADLSERAVHEWLSSVLGDAPSLGRLASYLYVRSNGRAASVAAMLRALIDRGEVRYRDGVWVLPAAPAQIALPEHADEAALERLQALPASARALAEALCMHRASFSPGLCALIGGSDAERGSELLVGSGLWLRGTEGYRFASDALRERVLAGIDSARAARLHSQLAAAILALPEREHRARTPDEELTAAVHMLEARDVAGVPLAVRAAMVIWDRAAGLASVVRLLERALDLSRPLGISATGRLALLAPLGLAAYTVDHRLARHEPEICEALDKVAGLDIARRLEAAFKRVHKRLGVVGAAIGLGIGIARYYLRPRGSSPDHPRPAPVRIAIRLGVSALIAIAGKAAISLDRVGAMRVVDHMRSLRILTKKDSGGFSVAYCRGLAMATEDRYERTYQYWLDLERRIATPGSLADVQGEQRALWEAGVSYVLGLFEGFRGDPRALTRAERLERSHNGLHRMIATQIRLQYHGFRGEAEQVRSAYERMEACAIEVGSSWQVETWSAIAINLFGALWHDIIITKRALRDTQRMMGELPSLKRYAITSEAVYLMRRGQPRDCADLYEPLLADEPPMSRIGWSVSSGLLAEAYNQLGMHTEAKALCERVLSTVSAEDRPYYAMRIAIEVPYGVALAGLGEYDKARAHLLGLLECYAQAASPAALGTVHETLAKIELAELGAGRGDRKRFTEHLKQVERYFTTLGNPALIARFQALSDVAGQGGGLLTKVALTREVRAFESALEPISDRQEGARAILAWLMQSCEGYEGYLFARRDELALVDRDAPLTDEPTELLAATSDKEPGDEVFRSVAEALDALGGSGDTTNFGTSAATRTRRDGSSTHLYLLSYLDADQFCAEGALVLLGRAPAAPPVRYELLQAAAFQLRRLTLGDVG